MFSHWFWCIDYIFRFSEVEETIAIMLVDLLPMYVYVSS